MAQLDMDRGHGQSWTCGLRCPHTKPWVGQEGDRPWLGPSHVVSWWGCKTVFFPHACPGPAWGLALASSYPPFSPSFSASSLYPP